MRAAFGKEDAGFCTLLQHERCPPYPEHVLRTVGVCPREKVDRGNRKLPVNSTRTQFKQPWPSVTMQNHQIYGVMPLLEQGPLQELILRLNISPVASTNRND